MHFDGNASLETNSKCENDEVYNLFNKKYSFKKSPKYRLPAARYLFRDKKCDFSRLQEFKKRLNSVKSSLDNYPIEEWGNHTRRRNLAGDICWRLKTIIRAEFVTNAWCKFFEILHEYRIVTDGILNSVHLCEAPGAFIAALNHYLHSTHKTVEWRWLSTTLNPYYEGNPLNAMVMDDRFMLHTLDNWVFGEDFTGNIMDNANIEYIAEYAEAKLGSVDLVTADGSIDCMETPGDQEQVVSALHYSETVAAIRLLSKGGCFVLKMFTFFENCSVNLLYFINCVFDTVSVFKPANSKAGNSEVYVICLNFLGDEVDNFEECFDVMRTITECDKKKLSLFQDIPEEFVSDLEDCAEFFMELQIEVIENNILYFQRNMPYEAVQSKQNRNQCADYYIEKYNLERIPENMKILNEQTKKIEQSINSRLYTGSYAERISKKNLPNDKKLKLLKTDLDYLDTFFYQQKIRVHVCNKLPKTNIIVGKPFKRINSSLFIDSNIMRHLLKILETDGLSLPTNFVASCSIKIDGNHEDEEEISKIDVDHFFLLNANFNQAERTFFCDILDSIISKQPDIIIFRNVPFLTHFSMSCSIFLWSRIYEYLTIAQDLTITFNKLRRPNKDLLNLIRKIVFKSAEYNEIITFIDIPYLHKNPFSSAFEKYNNKLCYDYGQMLLNHFILHTTSSLF